MKIQRSLTTIVALAALSFSLLAQPHIDLRPDRTVFFYAKDAKAASAAVQNDPVMAKDVEALGIPMQNPIGMDQPETIDKSGTMAGVSDYCRMDIYRPRNPNGKMVIVCPGGAYAILATYNEGLYPADWLLKQGVTVGVLKYRLPNGSWNAPLEDVHNAFRYIRSHADELGVSKVGIMGFSAGGHLAASGVVLYDDPVTRPDFGILVYPVVSMDAAITHAGSRYALLGKDTEGELVERFSCEKHVTPDTPRVFLALCFDDMVVSPLNSLRFYEACLQNKVNAEMHLYPRGVHGWGFNLQEYDMRDSIGYCREEFLHSLSRWLESL